MDSNLKALVKQVHKTRQAQKNYFTHKNVPQYSKSYLEEARRQERRLDMMINDIEKAYPDVMDNQGSTPVQSNLF